MDGDPTIARIREARMRISEQFDHDPKQLVEHYMKLQERHKDRLVRPDETLGTNSDNEA